MAQPPETRLDLTPSEFPTPDPNPPTEPAEWRLRPGRPPLPVPAGEDDPAAAAIMAAFDVMSMAPPVRPNLHVPGFDVLREIGAGGMGVVYLARQLGVDRAVALKVLRAGAFAGEGTRARFAEEARIVARLRHRDIVQLHDVGEADGLPFLAFEYVPGPTLARACGGKPQDARGSARVVERIARAVQYAHEQGVVHRDLKPSNILLQSHARRLPEGSGFADSAFDIRTGAFSPKIADFGLAKVVGDTQIRTDTGLAAGTPGYMAPEQVTSDKSRLGPWTDVFAMGVILYEMLTGKLPYTGDSPAALLLAPANVPPTPLNAYRRGVPKDLETVCMKCLAKEPEGRYLTAAALADDLQRFLDARPVLARRSGLAERTWKLFARSPVATGLAAALLVSLVVGFGIISRLYVRAENERQTAEDRLVRAEKAEGEAKEAAARAADAEQRAKDNEAKARASEDAAKKAEAAAREDREQLDAVNRFLLVDILQVARPPAGATGGVGSDVNVRTAVLGAAALIESRFGDRPVFMAVMDHTVGVTLRDLGSYTPAIEHLRRADKTLRKLRKGDDRAGVRVRADLGVCLGLAGKHAEALDALNGVLKVLEGSKDPTDDDFRLAVRRAVADQLNGLKRFDEAEKVLAEVVVGREKLNGPNHPQTVAVMVRLSGLYREQGKLDRAEAMARDAVVRAERIPGAATPALADALDAVGLAILNLEFREPGKHRPEYLAATRQAHEASVIVYGPRHPYTLERLANLVVALRWMERYEEIAGILPPVLAEARTRFGPDHARTVMLTQDLSLALANLGRLAEAVTIAEAALADVRARLGPDHASAVGLANHLKAIRGGGDGAFPPATIPAAE